MNIRLIATTALALALTGCGKQEQPTPSGGGTLSAADKVEAIASTLQACSYEGEPVTAQAGQLGGQAPGECSVAVQRIMGFTGLPANFVVVAGPVDNAAAVILLDQNRIPRRVIAFNPSFMSAARARVNGDQWGPMSIMAHEIAHHLSGHTIVPGGSRPEIELEADKFSGYVLQKMGAPLTGATEMIMAVGTPHGTPTHPGRDERAAAIRQGWTEACRQSGRSDCNGSGSVAASATPPAETQPQARAIPAVLSQPGTIHFKDGRFIIDETGKLDPARARAIEQRLYALAKDVGVEFTILMVNDLKGMSAQDFAWAMMRQLRVGKLDVGNGAVVVVAPRQRQAAVALGPGFAKEAEFSHPERQLLQWIDAAWPYCEDADGCQGWTDNLINIFNLTLNNAAHTKWRIEYQTLGQLIDHYERQEAERLRAKRPFDDKVDQPLGSLLRVNGRITSLRPAVGWNGANQGILSGPLGYTAVEMKTDDGYPLILYVSPRLAGLMPSGQLKEGQSYTIVGRLQKRGDKHKQASGMWLFSYDPLA